MRSFFPVFRPQAAHLPHYGEVLALTLLPLLLGSGPALAAGSGQWTPAADWRGGDPQKYAVHLMLLPGDGSTEHSRIVWWRGENATEFLGGQWGWRTGGDGCAAFPSGNFAKLSVPRSGVNFFCTGNAVLGTGEALLVGGHDPVSGSYGENRARVLVPGACGTLTTWKDSTTMGNSRWYPGTVALRTGDILTLSGSTYPFLRLFGGQRGSTNPPSPPDDSLYRFSTLTGGRWGPSVIPQPDLSAGLPLPRTGHSAVELNGVPGFWGQAYFGGQRANGTPLNDVWILDRKNDPLGSDFLFTWSKKSPSGSAPVPRSDHSAVGAPLDTMMIVYGGLDQQDHALGDAWRLHWSEAQGFVWRQIGTIGNGPSARSGHAAIYDVSTRVVGTTSQTLKRMIVFGGAETGGTPTDSRAWELRFDRSTPDSASWFEMPLAAGSAAPPAPRYWHRMLADPTLRPDHPGYPDNRWGHAALLFGGKLANSACSDTLWKLWIYPDSVRWERRSVSDPLGEAPGARARHSLSLDLGHAHGQDWQESVRLFVFGGRTAAGAADSFVYVVDPWAVSPSWSRWAAAGATLSGHTALPEFGGDLVRVPELYHPATRTWQALTASPLLEPYYPPSFLVPGGASGASRVVSVGYRDTYWLDVPATGETSAWQAFPNGHLDFDAPTGVSYRPGRLMVAGGFRGGVVGATRTLDASSTSNSWAVRDSLVPRVNHNLVLLPTGQVLAVGGVGDGSVDSVTALATAVHAPQLWTPPADNGSGGGWSDATTLAAQPTLRDYHSTAILLPDGRVLSAGGETTVNRGFAELFCPPYLFKADGVTLAQRPTILATPPAIGWGESLMVSVTDTTGIRSACLIRPGATTHAVDQNQRFVPLSFTPLGNPARLSIVAPATPDEAPPGYYLLFVVGSPDGDQVPSIARWIRLVDRGWGGPPDLRPPGTLTDFWPDAVSQTSAYFTWTATADDSGSAASGPTREYELRRSSQPIDSEARWNAASGFCGEPAPEPEGTAQDYTATGLSACTWYDFALRTSDEQLNRSLLQSDRIFLRTLCAGGGGGGYAARAAERNAAFRATSGALVAETDRASRGGWQLTLRALGSTEGLEGAGAGVSIQARDASGAWRTRSHFTPGAEEPTLGLCALREGGRSIVAGDFGLQQVAGAFTVDSAMYTLASAVHSSQGLLDVVTLAAGSGVALAVGDTLRLRYAPASAVDSTAASWYLLAGRGLLVTATRQQRAAEGAALPLRFALHPNAPNPFAATTTIRFDLPVGAIVRLEVFDVAGRRVGLLANHYFPPGYQAVEWDRRTPAGLAAGAGVYFYRLAAGPWRDRKKMVLLP